MISFLLFNTVAHAAEDDFVMFSAHKVWCPFKPPAIGSVECPDGYICKDHECQKPALGSSAKVWCPFKPPAIGSVECPNGYICKDHECQKPALGSSADRAVCTVKPPGIGAWLCEEGEECVDHKCVQRLGASANPVSGLGGKCGFPGYLDGETYDCEAGLVCNRHGKAGGYGSCEQASLGSWHPARSPNPVLGASSSDNNRVVCTVRPPGFGAWLCEEGEDCINHECVPSLGIYVDVTTTLGSSGGIHTVGVGGRCELNGMNCQVGLECTYNPNDPEAGAYGTCESALGAFLPVMGEHELGEHVVKPVLGERIKPILFASSDEIPAPLGEPFYPAYLGASSDEIPAPLGEPFYPAYLGASGDEIPAPLGQPFWPAYLGASANPVSGLGGKCGFPGYPAGETYDCEAGLVCNRHGKAGGYGSCEQASLGSWHPARSPNPVLGASSGYHYCQKDSDCPSSKPICHHPGKEYPDLMPSCIAEDFGAAPLGGGIAGCMTDEDCPTGKSCVNPLVMGAPVEGWCM